MELDDNLYSQSKYYPLDPLSEDNFIGDTQEFSFEVNNNTNIHNSENEADIVIDWYSDKKACIDQQTHFSVSMYQITGNTLSQLPLQPLLFGHLTDIRKIAIAKQKQTPKQKYGLGMGYTKKALNYAIWANKVSEFVNYLETFIEEAKVELDK
ncbi:40629_t:CDS:2 [Gigaspora margarita]|uniref:40629_t:CDS:1 n=1 Tax=Gigaspora margarita TaxID=4874 RepID=A0ABN7WJY8_GIGMA|nr:40629_t:CDS:2 [Gigaspora margarita]